MFLFLALCFLQFSDIAFLRRFVGLERRNFYSGSACKLGQQHACRQMHREILDFCVGQCARVNTQVIELALKQATNVLIPNL